MLMKNLVLMGLVLTAFASPAWAQGPVAATPSAPTAPTQTPAAMLSIPYAFPITNPILLQQLAAKTNVIELFTSLDCLFCPRAEKLLADISSRQTAITFACHTDTEGDAYPLARTFCADRQARYAKTLSDGLAYTPQMIINGHIDAVGHEFDDVVFGLKKAVGMDAVAPLTVRSVSAEQGMYAVDVPAMDLGKNRTADISLITLRAPYTVPKMMQQSATHPDPMVRIANRFMPVGGWHGQPKTLTISWTPTDIETGFIVIIQKDNGPIVAAGEFKK